MYFFVSAVQLNYAIAEGKLLLVNVIKKKNQTHFSVKAGHRLYVGFLNILSFL